MAGIWTLGTCTTVNLGEGQKPRCGGGGMLWSLAEKAGGERRTWWGQWDPGRCCFLHTDIWREEGCVSPGLKSRDR